MGENLNKRYSKIFIYLFLVYIIILSLLTFTDMANIFANSIGLRTAYDEYTEVPAHKVKIRHESNPVNIYNYNFEPNNDRFIGYSIIGSIIIVIAFFIETIGSSSASKDNSNKKIE